MIIYIHGFSSSGQGIKALQTKKYFGEDRVMTPSLSYIPALAMETLEQMVVALKKHETVSLIGSSLGGYFAIYLAEKYDLKAVLINPSIRPYETLKKVDLYPPSYYDGSTFEWKEMHIQTLKKFEVDEVKHQSNFMQLLQTGDEVLDFQKALDKLPQAENIVEEGGSHGFDDFLTKLPLIEAFLAR